MGEHGSAQRGELPVLELRWSDGSRSAPFRRGKGSGYEVYVGFVPDGTSGDIQGSDNVAGLSVNRVAGKGTLSMSLSHKEAGGPDPNIRGDQFGNFAAYGPAGAHDQQGDFVDLTLRVDDKSISARAGTDYSESHPLGLSGKFWRSARLVVRCKNNNDGRGSVTVDQISVDCPQQLSRFVQPINLRPIFNMGFRDEVKGDEKGGWTDQGDNDLRNLKPGQQEIRSIPFDIVDPDSNGGKSCLMLYSKNRTYFPKQSGPVPVNGMAQSLVFLHSAAWAHTSDLAARYVVRYDDGSQVPSRSRSAPRSMTGGSCRR